MISGWRAGYRSNMRSQVNFFKVTKSKQEQMLWQLDEAADLQVTVLIPAQIPLYDHSVDCRKTQAIGDGNSFRQPPRPAAKKTTD